MSAKKKPVFQIVEDDEELILLPGTDHGDGRQPVDWEEFWGKPAEPIRYLVEPLLAVGEITRVYAQAKVGKSLLVQECAAALAMGREVLGQRAEPIDVLYIDQENTQEDWKTRLTDMGYGLGDDWGQFHWYSLQSWPPLDTPDGGAALATTLQHHEAELVVIDTQSKMLDGEEDKQPTQAAFYQHTLMRLKRLGVTVVIIDHAGNDPSKPRGSSGKRDDVDTVWQVTKRGENKLALKRTHHRKLHAVNEVYIDRLTEPLRHVIAGDVGKEEQAITECAAAIQALNPPPIRNGKIVGRKAIEELRAAAKADGRKGFRDQVVYDAVRRLNDDDK